MELYSTRDKNVTASSRKALTKGLSNEGGLYCPKLNDITSHRFDIKDLLNNSYSDTAKYIFRIFLSDLTEHEIDNCIKNAYNDKNFSHKEIAPVTKMGENFLLELYHGPTSAFKDVALTILPQFLMTAYRDEAFPTAKDSSKLKRVYILTATSGDTGKAALSGFKDISNTSITIFYPTDGVSPMQKLQMQTSEGNNVEVFGINDNFDTCQKLVKDIYVNPEIRELCKENDVILTSANSMNIGRLVPQIVYYIQSYISLVNRKEINLYNKVNFAVPTGNFGDILAGYIAKLLGLPINKLICASNKNDVLTEFINTGVYNKNREFYKTIAPSIDILVSSNAERLLFWLSGDDDKYVADCMSKLSTDGRYTVTKEILDKLKNDFVAYSSDETECSKTIHDTFNIDKRLIDTHTAIAYSCLKKYQKDNPSDKSKSIVLSTASPYKFVKAVLKAITNDNKVDNLDEFTCLEKLHELSKEPIPKNLSELNTKEIRFKETFDTKEALNHVIANIKGVK